MTRTSRTSHLAGPGGGVEAGQGGLQAVHVQPGGNVEDDQHTDVGVPHGLAALESSHIQHIGVVCLNSCKERLYT